MIVRSSVRVSPTPLPSSVLGKPLTHNALYYGITDDLMRRLQSIQTAAAQLVMGTRRCHHISPVFRHLHWLPVRQRVEFKVATLVHHVLCGHAPATWLTTAVSSPTLSRKYCARLTLVRFSSVGREPISEIERSMQLDLESGTIC